MYSIFLDLNFNFIIKLFRIYKIFFFKYTLY
jgi:hypothetical protein